ncbi:isopentenyl pyrophosphate isomerase domain protein, partial [Streptococcus pneumoniae GA11304]
IFARFTNFNFCRWVTSQVAIDSSHKNKDIKCVSQMRLMPAVCF